jgi:hypothetical protein
MRLRPWFVCAWLVALVSAGMPAAAEEPLLLPTVEVLANASDARDSEAPDPRTDSLRLVAFAGGALDFELPRGWVVKEVPSGREIRLLAGPAPLPTSPNNLIRGCWLMYERYVPTAGPRPSLNDDLQRSLRRLPEVGALLGRPRAITVGRQPALRQNVELIGDRGTGAVLRASHVVAQTPWGLLELHGIAPVDVADDVRGGLNLVLSSLRFHNPRQPPLATSPDVTDAQGALGHWKGQYQRLHLTPTGGIVMDMDPLVTASAAPPEPPHGYEPGTHLTGRFRAEDDLIYVTWNDGSPLNFRWKVQQGDLLLLDHSGRYSRLKRLFDVPEPPQEGQHPRVRAEHGGNAVAR